MNIKSTLKDWKYVIAFGATVGVGASVLAFLTVPAIAAAGIGAAAAVGLGTSVLTTASTSVGVFAGASVVGKAAMTTTKLKERLSKKDIPHRKISKPEENGVFGAVVGAVAGLLLGMTAGGYFGYTLSKDAVVNNIPPTQEAKAKSSINDITTVSAVANERFGYTAQNNDAARIFTPKPKALLTL